tara:strand:+ start:11517 stop:14471 length:2955 start_codon:yes stop_codon:yes gene_type:complete
MKLTSIVFLLLVLSYSCSEDTELNQLANHFHIVCGGENISGIQFQEGNKYLDNIECRTDLYSRSGRHCFKLNYAQQFGPSLRIDSIKQGDVVYASVYRKKGSANAKLVITSKDEVQYESNEISLEEKVEWELVRCSFVAKRDYEYVSVYIWNPLKEDAFLDDLSIDCFRNNNKPHGVAEKDILRINIPQSALDSITEFRDRALVQEVITSDLKTYFKASVELEGNMVPVSLRLKGDWVDHLDGEKWSFRIKFKGSNAYHGMKKFSIQDPCTRSFMMEWFGHKLFEKEDVLTTRYQFKVVYINGVNRGVYALEEHFDKRLLEYRKRREGPIVKFDENGVWQGYYDQQKYQHGFKKFPYLESAEILPFSKKRTRKNPVLLNQFILAQSHMSRFRNLDTAFQEYLDIDKMARFVALCDVMNATHGLIWHNQRNYLNPVNGVLEPVAYDCFAGQPSIHYELLGMAPRWREEEDFSSFDALFLNQEFNQRYIRYLKRFSSKDYMEESFLALEEEILYFESLLKHEYPLYSLNKDYFLLNQYNVREKVKDYENQPKVNRNVSKKDRYIHTAQNVVFDEVALKVYTKEADSLSGIFQFENYLLSPIQIIGYSTKSNKNTIFTFEKEIELAAFVEVADKKTQGFSFKPRRVYYKTHFTGDSLHSVKVSPFPPVVRKSIMNFQTSEISKVFYHDTDELRFKANGIYNFNKTVYIPSNKKLVIEQGVHMKLSNGARFVCYGPVEMKGTEDNPIRIEGIGAEGGGVVLFPNRDSVEMSYVIYNNLTDANTNNWTLTGGVTIYEGQVSLRNCSFLNARSEDALNLIRCTFQIDGILIDKTYSDGFDADFCNGQLKNSVFKSTGNDCIDFSGSQIDIEACEIFDSGDKGISGGENSILSVRNCSISKASIGIASKDKSFVKVDRTSIESCDFAFAAYRKKAEFGPAKIDVKSSTLKNIKKTYLLERDSEIKHLEKINIGTEMFNIDSMYQKFSKVGT